MAEQFMLKEKTHKDPVTPLTTPSEEHHKHALLLMAIPMIVFPILDAVVKVLMQSGFHLLQVASARFLFHSIFFIALLLYNKQSLIKVFSTMLYPKIIIAFALMGITIGFYIALLYTSISIALAVLFTAPILTLLISVPILKERLTMHHITACIIGFIGALLIIRPGTDTFNTGALFALIASISWSTMNIVSRKYGAQLNTKETQCFSGVVSTVVYVIGLATISHDTVLTAGDTNFWITTFIMGMVSGILYMSMQLAHTYAPASTLAPLQYLEIISGLILDLLLWKTVPDTTSWIGINIIIISGLIVWRLNRKKTA